jgi:hypothetical protein
MKTIQRLYVYLVAFISLEVVLWGLIGLARSIFSDDQIGGANQLASALSLILVGVPVFLLHWWLAQRNIDDPDERFARLRAIFVYGSLLATLIPVVQNILALVSRLWLSIFGLVTDLAIIGEGQSWIDNLLAILMNGLIAAYFLSVERKDWSAAPQGDSYPESRRLYRYIWVIYALAMVVGGVQQVLYFLLNLSETIGDTTQAGLANGLALLIVGTPLWYFWWQRIVGQSLEQPPEKQSILRIFVLYALSLIGIGGVLIPAGLVLDVIFRAIFGEMMSGAGFITEISGPLSAAVSFGGIWAYYGRVLITEVEALPATPRRDGLRRLYNYILAAIGLITTVVGVSALFSFVIDTLIGTFPWGITLREKLAAALATLIVGLPLWILTWQPLVSKATQEGEAGDHARRSLTRKIYLFAALFAGVIGVMVSAGSLIFQILSTVLGEKPDNFQRASLVLLEMLIIFAGLLAYHWVTLRADGRRAEQSLAARHEAFPVLVLTTAIGEFSNAILAALQREMPSLPAVVHVVDSGVPDETLSAAEVVIVPGELAANPPEAIRLWLQGFAGTKLVVPTPAKGWLWTFGTGKPITNLVEQAAKMVRHLAEGEDISAARETSPWMVVLYIVAALVGVPLLISLFSILGDILY